MQPSKMASLSKSLNGKPIKNVQMDPHKKNGDMVEKAKRDVSESVTSNYRGAELLKINID